ncbi:Methyltransferase domain-containing protein [Pedobacter steynii]|uniref:Methyltransferase domain-containing protein n=1 Tax=Pedobacter steynii TaxID=430522 RepID=A0A1H0JM32_9SPHI|nr:class I SAM-dependent methyltransferase [Pedobacter steynii]NQX43104.1 class I SAM-dependent methyltransferase [Pedobacter steynii]SDO44580.1 Methyltransferase domain-containing protein [Pedobacter steynii]
MKEALRQQFGNIDIYLFDQLLKGTYDDCQLVLDAGCGQGRNVAYFLQSGYQVYGVDSSANHIASIKQLAAPFSDHSPQDNFRIGAVENLPFKDETFDLVISSAVLHFANDALHFEEMLSSMWRVVRPGGYLFCRLASDIGIEHLVRSIGNGRYLLPDGSERFLVSQEMLLSFTKALGATQHEPIKTTNVQNLRAMTTWCLQK